MDKQQIINEIHRTAINGKAAGYRRFAAETSIKVNDWRGRYWARWSDALQEAGYSQNEWKFTHDESFLFDCLLGLVRKLQKYPTQAEIKLERRIDPNFPGLRALRNRGSKAELIGKLLNYCQSHQEFADLTEILRATPVDQEADAVAEEGDATSAGYVYLICAQNAYKVGCTRAPYRRVAEIANQSANGAELIHLSPTDDPEGIEKYWHNRFDEKRIEGINKQSGEWFKLSKDEIKAFKRRKGFM